MANKKIWVGMLVMALAFSMTVVGCGSLFSSTPKSFTKGSGGETTVLLRQGLNFDQAFREAVFVLSRHGFEPEMMQPEAGYIRTRWNTTWINDGKSRDEYRVRILITFNPSRTQLIVSAPAEYSTGGDKWIVGYDTRAIETLRTDLTQSIGN
jgi:hypothetical protein